MRNHYLPKYYLKGFSDKSGDYICVYDKSQRSSFKTHLKNVAVEAGFYPPEVDQRLANQIEGPANKVLAKIRRPIEITDHDKSLLAKYLLTVFKRVPRGKQRVKEHILETIRRFRHNKDQLAETIMASNPQLANLAPEDRDQVRRILRDQLDDLARDPQEVYLKHLQSEETDIAIPWMTSMTWQFLTFDDEPAFLTCDNPFYLTPIGLLKPRSEFSFPISSHIILSATRRTGAREGYLPTSERVVKQMNRRIAANATRFVYHSRDEEWILPFITKPKWRRAFVP
jgi:hypothetical protein